MRWQLLLCLLVGSARSGQSKLAPPEGDATVDQLLDSLAGFIETSVRRAAIVSLADLGRRLDGIEHTLSNVVSRQEGMQQALDNASSRLEGVQQVLDAVSSQQKSMRQVFDAGLSRQENVQKTLASVSTAQDSVQQALGASSSRQEDIQQALNGVSGRQEDIRQALRDISEHQQSVQTVPSNFTWQVAVDQKLESIAGAISLLPQRTLGSSCNNDTDCSAAVPNSVCGSERTCVCRDGLMNAGDNVCRQYPRLTEACTETSQCLIQTQGAVCSDLVCSCPVGHWNRGNVECRPGIASGRACTYDEDCSTHRSNFTCTAGTCAERVCEAVQVGDYEYRLAGGESCDQGRIELRRAGSGSWGYVCDDNWDNNDAGVFCRSVGFGSGMSRCCSWFGNTGSNRFYMDDVACSGSESRLTSCRSSSWGSHNCGPTEIAGVICASD